MFFSAARRDSLRKSIIAALWWLAAQTISLVGKVRRGWMSPPHPTIVALDVAAKKTTMAIAYTFHGAKYLTIIGPSVASHFPSYLSCYLVSKKENTRIPERDVTETVRMFAGPKLDFHGRTNLNMQNLFPASHLSEDKMCLEVRHKFQGTVLHSLDSLAPLGQFLFD